MSSSSSLFLVLAIACFVSLISPAISQSCSTQNVRSTDRTKFETCLDLPHQDSFLHYTYDASNSSLSVAFVATPSRSDGWVAWAINPTMPKMNGSQAFLAYRSRAGSVPVVKTYNISGYRLIEGKLAFDFWNLRAESMSNGSIAIFATVKIPAGAESVNQVWQIGGNVTDGIPGVHPFTPENLNSTAVLKLTGGGSGGTPTPTAGGAGSPGNGGSIGRRVNFGVNLGILVLLGSIFIF
ncbi:unnamed protein product [Cochlearia groenlandica]